MRTADGDCPDGAAPPSVPAIGDVVMIQAVVRAVIGDEVFLEARGGHRFWVGIKDIVQDRTEA